MLRRLNARASAAMTDASALPAGHWPRLWRRLALEGRPAGGGPGVVPKQAETRFTDVQPKIFHATFLAMCKV